MFNTEKALITSLGIAAVITIGIMVVLNSKDSKQVKYEYDQYGSISAEEANHISEETTAIMASSSNVIGSGVQVYTLDEIGLHASESDCWTVIDGTVYDLTQFINEHPGGKKGILSICGRDGGADFHGAHEKGGRAQAVVFAKYKAGILK